jgi:hypothetical protein
MNTMQSINVAIRSVLVLSILPAVALAQTSDPASCFRPVGRAIYDRGFQAGVGLVQQLWSSVNDCDQFGHFHDMVVDDVSQLTLPPNPSIYTQCRYMGTVDGTFEELVQILAACAEIPNTDPYVQLMAAPCISTGGQIDSAMCCEGVTDFPPNQLGPCGCAPWDSHPVATCVCTNGFFSPVVGCSPN